MRIATAQLTGGESNADRVFVLDHAVLVLDGATAFEPGHVDPAHYASALGSRISDQLDEQRARTLPDIVETAIKTVARDLQLTPGRAPSSTVTILRKGADAVDLYVLGDSPLHYGNEHAQWCLVDHRLAELGRRERSRYVEHLRSGSGFDTQHRANLADLQRAQRAARNRPHGYWIAEAEPSAARHALTRTIPLDRVTWAVLATDGAADLIDDRGPDWTTISRYDAARLAGFLRSAHEWERYVDPDGRHLPRAKRHDDKTIAAVQDLRSWEDLADD